MVHFASPAQDSGLPTQRETNRMPQRAETEGVRMAVHSEGKKSLTGVRWERRQRLNIYGQ